MAEKLLKKTEDMQIKKRRVTNREKKENLDDIYKIDLNEENLDLESQEINIEDNAEEKTINTKSKKAAKNNIIKVIEDDEDDIDDVFGNVNRWLNEDELEENIKKQKEKKAKRKRLTKIEDGIKTSKKTKTAASTAKIKRKKTNIQKNAEIEEIAQQNQQIQQDEEDRQGEIKIHAENDVTEILLKHNKYKIELQKLEYNIYTENSETSYIIVRDSGLRMIAGNVYVFLQKQGEDYEITTNQDFKINYVIDNLKRKENTVNFKLTNLTEILANEDGLTFEIDEEKVIENNLEDNKTLVISEEDGKVYLPYTKEEIKQEAQQNKGTKISELIENNYILPLDNYKNSIRARFREGYNLMYKREGKSKKSAILLGIELMFETNLHPAIISACKNLEELDIYLDCLEDNELEKFSCFKIIYKSLPTLRKKAKFQEF